MVKGEWTLFDSGKNLRDFTLRVLLEVARHECAWKQFGNIYQGKMPDLCTVLGLFVIHDQLITATY
jgi:hypothetical protein